jgi:hypothetical protein
MQWKAESDSPGSQESASAISHHVRSPLGLIAFVTLSNMAFVCTASRASPCSSAEGILYLRAKIIPRPSHYQTLYLGSHEVLVHEDWVTYHWETLNRVALSPDVARCHRVLIMDIQLVQYDLWICKDRVR